MSQPLHRALSANRPQVYSKNAAIPVQFWAAAGLTEDAVREAENLDYQGIPARVFRAEHVVAIAANAGRAKDRARIEQLLSQADLDKSYLAELLQRYRLALPA